MGVQFFDARVAELADAADSKSAGSDVVWVRPPPRAPERFIGSGSERRGWRRSLENGKMQVVRRSRA